MARHHIPSNYASDSFVIIASAMAAVYAIISLLGALAILLFHLLLGSNTQFPGIVFSITSPLTQTAAMVYMIIFFLKQNIRTTPNRFFWPVAALAIAQLMDFIQNLYNFEWYNLILLIISLMLFVVAQEISSGCSRARITVVILSLLLIGRLFYFFIYSHSGIFSADLQPAVVDAATILLPISALISLLPFLIILLYIRARHLLRQNEPTTNG